MSVFLYYWIHNVIRLSSSWSLSETTVYFPLVLVASMLCNHCRNLELLRCVLLLCYSCEKSSYARVCFRCLISGVSVHDRYVRWCDVLLLVCFEDEDLGRISYWVRLPGGWMMIVVDKLPRSLIEHDTAAALITVITGELWTSHFEAFYRFELVTFTLEFFRHHFRNTMH